VSQLGLRLVLRSLLLPERSLRQLTLSDVRYRANEFNFTALICGRGMAHHPEVFHGSINHEQSLFIVKVLPFIGKAINEFSHHASVFRVRSLK
jgi:hypothetical protein